MSISIVCNKLDKIKNIENFINYKYEPHAVKFMKKWNRHIYFKDFKNEFIKELTTYGFSPFVHEDYLSQRRNPNIMKYKPQNFNYGLINYMHKKNIRNFDLIDEIDKKEREQKVVTTLRKKILPYVNEEEENKKMKRSASVKYLQLRYTGNYRNTLCNMDRFFNKKINYKSTFITGEKIQFNSVNNSINKGKITSTKYKSLSASNSPLGGKKTEKMRFLEKIEKSPNSIFKKAIKIKNPKKKYKNFNLHDI